MPRPYVPSFESESGNEGPPLSIAKVAQSPATRTSPERVVSNAPTRPPLVKQKHRKRKGASWYAVQAFSDVLLSERERRGWGQTALADHCAMGVSQYRKLERGENAPSIWLANRMCRRLWITFVLGDYPE